MMSSPYHTWTLFNTKYVGHNSAFEAIWGTLQAPSILLNALGNVTRFNNRQPNIAETPAQYEIHFDKQTTARPKRYLLQIINTSFESIFVFSIDNHPMIVVQADFVSIKTYTTTSVLVGIGQRYHIIVEAMPRFNDGDPPPIGGNFWIRTWKADCFCFNQTKDSPEYEKTGLLRYSDSKDVPKSTQWGNVHLACFDEPYANLVPVLPWTVQKPHVDDRLGGVVEYLTVQLNGLFPLALFSRNGDQFNPVQINYSIPTFLDLSQTPSWPKRWVLYPENYTATSWVSYGLPPG
jgi:hypothetical protein